MREFLTCAAPMVVLFLAGAVSFAGPITFYTDEQDFKDACGVAITTEDFSCSTAEPRGVCLGQTPLNSSTNDNCFNGCLSEGFEFNSVDRTQYVSLGTGFLGVELPVVGPEDFEEDSNFTFSPAAACVGFKVVGDVLDPVDVLCTFQPTGGVVAVHGTLQGVFIGAIDRGGITRVDCVEQIGVATDLYGALQFADVDGPPPPVPTTGIWGRTVLVGILLVGSWFVMGRRAEA